MRFLFRLISGSSNSAPRSSPMRPTILSVLDMEGRLVPSVAVADPQQPNAPPAAVAPAAPEQAPEPRRVDRGEGDPPSNRDYVPPTKTDGGVEYKPVGGGDPVRFGPNSETKETFPGQTSTTPGGTVTETVEVKSWGWRRFPNDQVNDSGNHIAYVMVQVRHTNRTITDANGVTTSLPDTWEQIGFSLEKGVFLRSVNPPALDTVTKGIEIKPGESWEDFLARYIAAARDIAAKQ